ncbi:MAG: class II aldolase/adducin family protein [Chloroflexi bacterium]|nr:class II aldolase/adducin family protein [Chloroflexota bacterium]
MDIRSENEMRSRIVEIGKLLHQKGLVAAGDGNISVRLDRERLLVTPSGFSKGFLDAEQLLVVNLAGEKVSPSFGKARDLDPSSEIRIHLECYRQRADVHAVIHAHPPMAIACTLAGVSLAKCVLPEVLYDLGTIPTAPYATPSSPEGPIAVRELIKQYDAIVLDRHGTVTVGATLWDAYMRLERVEHSAQVTLAAQQALRGPVEPLSIEAIQKLAAMRQKIFGERGRDICVECNACPVSERHSSRQGGAVDLSRLEALIADQVRRALSTSPRDAPQS